METLIKDYYTLKQALKTTASQLRDDKANIKITQKEGGSGAACTLQYNLIGKKRSYRHCHIAYSMMRGRSYEEIENKCREDNKPDMDLVKRIIDEYSPKDVRACA